CTIKLHNLNQRVFPVLPRHGHAPASGLPTPLIVNGHPRPQDDFLPRVRRKAKHRRNLYSRFGVAGIPARRPRERRLLIAFKHYAPRVFFFRICSISSSRLDTSSVTADPPRSSSSSREMSAALSARDATSRPESDRERVTRTLSRRSSRTFSCGFIRPPIPLVLYTPCGNK